MASLYHLHMHPMEHTGQTVLSLRYPEVSACSSWACVDGVRRQCGRPEHGTADGSDVTRFHVWEGNEDREAWTDMVEETELRGPKMWELPTLEQLCEWGGE